MQTTGYCTPNIRILVSRISDFSCRWFTSAMADVQGEEVGLSEEDQRQLDANKVHPRPPASRRARSARMLRSPFAFRLPVSMRAFAGLLHWKGGLGALSTCLGRCSREISSIVRARATLRASSGECIVCTCQRNSMPQSAGEEVVSPGPGSCACKGFALRAHFVLVLSSVPAATPCLVLLPALVHLNQPASSAQRTGKRICARTLQREACSYGQCRCTEACKTP